MAERIGLALSGGGSRAIAFHLGCLRALKKAGALDRVEVISTVSGGSVIGALYALHHDDFSRFEAETENFLKQGLIWPTLKHSLTSLSGVKALVTGVMLRVIAWILTLTNLLVSSVAKILPSSEFVKIRALHLASPIPRWASRTTLIREVLHSHVFERSRLSGLKSLPFNIIFNSADLRTGAAFYFSPKQSGIWRYGELADNDVPLSHAVAASAAHPLFLPALDEHLAFNLRNGSRESRHVVLTDGGIYDNTGLAPLWPDRDPDVSLNTTNVDAIICCRAGYGLRQDPPVQFFVQRLMSSFYCVHGRAENAAIKRLFDLKNSGVLQSVLLPFLGQDDSRLRYRPEGLVTREQAFDYPTDFAAMPVDWITRLSTRGEQLTEALLKEHWGLEKH